jgi:hypothetical protein
VFGLVACLGIFGMVWKHRTCFFCQDTEAEDADQRAQKAQCPKEFMTSVFHNTRGNVIIFLHLFGLTEMGFVLLTSIEVAIICFTLIEMGFPLIG